MPSVLLFLCYALSGFISLSYQVVWLRHFVDRFGSSTLTFVLVICSFIVGLGSGALLSRPLTGVLRRLLGRPNDLSLYGVVELLVSVSALLLFAEALLPVDLAGEFPFVSRGGIFEPRLAYELLKLPLAFASVFVPCLFMGVTFPLLCQAFSERGRFPARLYAWNTLGACCAVLVCELVWLRYLGTDRTFMLAVGLNLLLGVFFVLFGRPLIAACKRKWGHHPVTTDSPSLEAPWRGKATAPLTMSVILTGAIISGFLSGALEADAFRRLHFVGVYCGAGMAFISFWAIAGIFLGSWMIDRHPRWRLAHIKLFYAAALLYHTLACALLFAAKFWLKGQASVAAGRLAAWDPEGHFSYLASVFLLAGVAVFPSYLCISLLLPYLCNMAQQQGKHLGRVYGLNTLAFLAGMVLFSHLAPQVNTFYTFKFFRLVFLILVLLMFTLGQSRTLRRWALGAATVAMILAACVTPAGFDRDYLPEAERGRYQNIRALKGDSAHMTYVAETPQGDHLYFDTFSMSATNPVAQRYMRLMAHFPLLTHPEPKRALLICFGVGNTASAIAKHGSIETLDAVDLSRNVLETAPEFEMHNDGVYADPRVRLIHEDGRSFLSVTDTRYDLITSEPPPPLMQGVSRLYSAEYYRSVLRHLTPRGCMSQWLPIYQLPPQATRLLVSTFVDAFPHTLLLVGSGAELILVGSGSPLDLHTLEGRFEADPAVLGDLHDIGVPTPLHLLSRVLMTDRQLRARFGGGPIITDQKTQLSTLMYVTHRPGLALSYAPLEVLEDVLSDQALDCREELRATLTDLARLRRAVPDFRAEFLAQLDAEPGRVRGAELEWIKLEHLNRQAHAAWKTGRVEEASRLYERSLSYFPQQLHIWLRRAKLLSNLGQPAQAAKSLRRCVELFPEYQRVHLALAEALAQSGRPQEAMHSVQDALALNPRFYGAHLLAGDLYAEQGRRSQALHHYRRALELKPAAAEARGGLERLGGSSGPADD